MQVLEFRISFVDYLRDIQDMGDITTTTTNLQASIFYMHFFFFFLREFQLMASAFDDSSLSLDQDTNQFLV